MACADDTLLHLAMSEQPKGCHCSLRALPSDVRLWYMQRDGTSHRLEQDGVDLPVAEQMKVAYWRRSRSVTDVCVARRGMAHL